MFHHPRFSWMAWRCTSRTVLLYNCVSVHVKNGHFAHWVFVWLRAFACRDLVNTHFYFVLYVSYIKVGVFIGMRRTCWGHSFLLPPAGHETVSPNECGTYALNTCFFLFCEYFVHSNNGVFIGMQKTCWSHRFLLPPAGHETASPIECGTYVLNTYFYFVLYFRTFKRRRLHRHAKDTLRSYVFVAACWLISSTEFVF